MSSILNHNVGDNCVEIWSTSTEGFNRLFEVIRKKTNHNLQFSDEFLRTLRLYFSPVLLESISVDCDQTALVYEGDYIPIAVRRYIDTDGIVVVEIDCKFNAAQQEISRVLSRQFLSLGARLGD
jgi:hypothetical protein